MGWVSWMIKDEVSESPLLASFLLRCSSAPHIMVSIMAFKFFDRVSRCRQILDNKEESGAECRTRTDDLPLTRRLLYQLS